MPFSPLRRSVELAMIFLELSSRYSSVGRPRRDVGYSDVVHSVVESSAERILSSARSMVAVDLTNFAAPPFLSALFTLYFSRSFFACSSEHSLQHSSQFRIFLALCADRKNTGSSLSRVKLARHDHLELSRSPLIANELNGLLFIGILDAPTANHFDMLEEVVREVQSWSLGVCNVGWHGETFQGDFDSPWVVARRQLLETKFKALMSLEVNSSTDFFGAMVSNSSRKYMLRKDARSMQSV
eukprot:IDg11534t1